jgi:hypothetical protein
MMYWEGIEGYLLGDRLPGCLVCQGWMKKVVN